MERLQELVREIEQYKTRVDLQMQRVEEQGMAHFNSLEQLVNNRREEFRNQCLELRSKAAIKAEQALAQLTLREDWALPTVRVHLTSAQVASALAKSAKVELSCISPLLYHPYERELWRWDCCLRAWLEPITLSTIIVANKDSAWCFLNNSILFVSGSRVPPSSCAYQIDVTNGQVTILANMKIARGNHAVVAHRDEVVAFGGYWVNPYESCECYSHEDWKELSNMNEARSHFCPCRLDDRVFLCGGTGAVHMEVFNWLEKSFKQLPQTIPPDWWTSAFVWEDSLVVLCTFQYYKWRIDSEKPFQSFPTTRMSSGWSPCPVQRYHDRVFVMCSVYNTVVEVKLPEVQYITNYGFFDYKI